MSEFYYLVRKNIKLIFKSKFSIIQLLAPVAVSLLILKLFTGMGGNLTYGVVDKDSSVSSKFLISKFEVNRSTIKYYDNEETLIKDITNRDISGGFLVPEGFQESIIGENIKNVDIYMGTNNNFKKSLEANINDTVTTLEQISTGALNNKDNYIKIIEETKNKTIKVEEARLDDKSSVYQVTQMSIGLLIFFMMLRANSTSYIMLEEKRSNCYSRIFASPITPIKFIGANVVANLLVLVMQAVVTLLSMKWILKLETDIPFGVLLFFLVLIAFVAVAFSTMVMVSSKDFSTASIVSNLFINISCMASGCYFPIEFIPENIRKISFLFPQTWVLDIFRKYQTSSVTIDKLYINIITLIAFAVTLLLIASFRMKFSNKEMTALND